MAASRSHEEEQGRLARIVTWATVAGVLVAVPQAVDTFIQWTKGETTTVDGARPAGPDDGPPGNGVAIPPLGTEPAPSDSAAGPSDAGASAESAPAALLSPAGLRALRRAGGVALALEADGAERRLLVAALRDAGLPAVEDPFTAAGLSADAAGRLAGGDGVLADALGLGGAPGTLVMGALRFAPPTSNGELHLTHADLLVTLVRFDGRPPEDRSFSARGADYGEDGAYRQAAERVAAQLAAALR